MALLKSTNTAPPGNWKYRQAETGLVLVGDSLQDLTRKTTEHRRYKGIKPDDLHTVGLQIQRQICTRLGADSCHPEPGDNWVPRPTQKRFTLQDILGFSRTIIEFVKSGMSLVPVDEMKRRRAICFDCPMNQRASGCKCGFLYRTIDAAVPKERRHTDLHICNACSCSLNAKVNVPMEVLRADKREIVYPHFCWMNDSNPALPPT